MTDNELLEAISEKLDTLIAIEALSAVAHLETKKQKILFLSEAGLAPKAIAAIVATSAASVSQTIYAEKKNKSGAK